jgi:23S rRNA (uridine2552-2'-O)-methyltransferase
VRKPIDKDSFDAPKRRPFSDASNVHVFEFIGNCSRIALRGERFFLQRQGICDRNSKMKGNRWDDHYARQARDEKWLARSVFKLQEIDKKFRLMGKGDRVLDLGCYPGSWSQYGIKSVGPTGSVVGIDLKQPDRISSPVFRFIQADVLTIENQRLVQEVGPRDLVMSDLAPQTTGIRSTDESRSLLLARRAVEIARPLLKKKGRFLCKVFEGEDFKAFQSDISAHFLKIQLYRPKATRKRSREVYVVGLRFIRNE